MERHVQMIGQSSSFLDAVERASRAAPLDRPVLVIGERGTGKELIAERLHHLSSRWDGPLIIMNCAALPETLIEAELFGHEAGAYTGATSARAGWFEAAADGTLFLDEVGDLPPAVQVKLLRVLQERQVVRIGSRKPIDVRVRLVAATNVRLEQAVAAGHFRADLYYRLSVATLQLSNLAQRPGDILALAEHFIGVYSRRLGLNDVRLAPDARDALLAYAWPGNIRELENVIHYALIICRDGRIVRAGGKVVKNVAGYDLGKLQIGGFGGFGLVTELNLRLRALPRADRTLIARARRDRLTNASRTIPLR